MRRDRMIRPMMITMKKRAKRMGPIMRIGLMELGGSGGLERRVRREWGRRGMVVRRDVALTGRMFRLRGRGLLRWSFRLVE